MDDLFILTASFNGVISESIKYFSLADFAGYYKELFAQNDLEDGDDVNHITIDSFFWIILIYLMK